MVDVPIITYPGGDLNSHNLIDMDLQNYVQKECVSLGPWFNNEEFNGRTCEYKSICRNGYEMSDEFQWCVKCSGGCRKCEITNFYRDESDFGVFETKCLECGKGNFLDLETQECKPCYVNCRICEGNKHDQCKRCADGFYREINLFDCKFTNNYFSIRILLSLS